VTTLGTTYAGLMGQDDEWCEEVTAAGRRAGELVWRLPLHAEYAELIKGKYGDILNAVENRRAASVTAAEFLRRFVGDVPWAHLDIAGTAWDTSKAYAPKGGVGYGVRLLVALASR
jgi:leucyl aminopeptidase